MLYKIFVPEELRYFYADEYGVTHDAPDDAVIEAPFSEAEAIDAVRQLRTDRLYQCDWTQLPDAPLSEDAQAQWRQYRQALRDMMDDFAWNVTTWPTL